MSDPGDLCLEAFQVVLLSLQVGLGNEDGEVAILDPKLLDPSIEEILYGFPNCIGAWLKFH